MRIVDGRRLTGANFLIASAGAAVEVAFDADESYARASRVWAKRVTSLCTKLGWTPHIRQRRHLTGASWALSAPIDQLNVAVDIAEVAVTAQLSLEQGELRSWPAIRRELARRAEAERNPALLALQVWAAQEQIPLLWDEDVVSLGTGPHSLSWPARDLPEPQALNPSRFSTIPTALITGTNGKTTTSRWLTRMARCAGKHTGNTTTDGWCIDELLLESGDWTGPGAARKVLRDARVEVAVLESARGGLLRRGLALNCADVAVVTNVSDDHLGEWGIDDVATMAEVKLSIANGLHAGGTLVVNAGNVATVAAVERLGLHDARFSLAWFGQDPLPDALVTARNRGAEVAWSDGRQLWWQRGAHKIAVATIADIPLCFGGHAQHNIDNALCALLAARGLGLPLDAIAAGLRAFSSSPADNPGRANILRCKGFAALLDFAHNPDGVRHIVQLTAALPAARRLITLGQAGDRSDEAIAELVDEAAQLHADHYILKESLHYLRGRELGEVTGLMRKRLLARGVPPHHITVTLDEHQAVDAALQWARPGDLLILLIHDDFAAALAQLQAAGAVPA